MYGEYILAHACAYPLMRTEDYVKLLYQSEYGAHSKIDADTALKYIEKECAKLEFNASPPLSQDISPSLCRIDLIAYLQKNYPLPLLAGLFSRSYEEGSVENLFEKLEEFCVLCDNKALNLSAFAVRNFVSKYKLNPEAISHSFTYKKNYNPHYRVVKKDYADILSLFSAVEANLYKGTVLIAVEGDSGGGKSYYSQVIKDYYKQRCNLFHADDFFLPQQRKTQKRLSEIGGNINYEDLLDLIGGILKGEEVSYAPFDCALQTFKEKITVKPAQINIIEGVYSAHPLLRKYYDIIADFNISGEEQHKRIFFGRGENMLARFNELWLPLEKTYLKDLRQNCKNKLTFTF